MEFFKPRSKRQEHPSKDDNLEIAAPEHPFVNFIEFFETWISKILAIAMLVVIIVAMGDLVIFLFREINPFSPTAKLGNFHEKLLKLVFGAFLNILIAFEILENITVYLKKHVVPVELVIITSLTAIGRKIILLEFDKTTGMQIVGLSLAIVALSVSYWILRHLNHKWPARH